MITSLRITVLVDNVARSPHLLAEHGLSFWIEADDHRVLFDTGQGSALGPNAKHLAVALERADVIVLSHGHYDHTGGLSHVLARAGDAPVYIHSLASAPKYAKRDETPRRFIGMPARSASDLLANQVRVHHTEAPAQVCPGIWITGQIPRLAAFEAPGGQLFLDEQCTKQDAVLDDQALFIESQDGLVVVLGCAHSGVVNTLDWIASTTGRTAIHAVLGGMHLFDASAEKLASTAAALERYGVQVVAPCHCTGEAAIAGLRASLDQRVADCFAGACFEFPGRGAGSVGP
jgi:7,8-dihydropterin-6-yl-methyl-4-(beta-D-ribofuranosyl)aminobenzene 5'-phosphate synthase